MWESFVEQIFFSFLFFFFFLLQLTHPVITSKVGEEHIDRGNIQGRDQLCDYLLDVSLGLEEVSIFLFFFFFIHFLLLLHASTGHPSVCNSITCGFLLHQTNDLASDRLYDLVARLECKWATCRLCQQRMYHVFDYCRQNGTRDWLLRGICEDRNPKAQDSRLRKLVS
jgi:hypothetical protein